jgi:hypothetical protein
MTSPDTTDSMRDTISRKKFLLATGAATGAALIGSALKARATGTNPAYLNVTETFTADQTFTGRAIFATGQPWVDVRAFGAVGTGVSGNVDDAPAIQAAINAAVSLVNGDDTANNPIIYFPPGDYLLKSGLVTPNSAGNFCMRGVGYQSSRLVWSTSAPVSQAMLQLVNPLQVRIEDLGFIGTTGSNMPTYGIQIRRASGLSGSAASKVSVKRVFLGGLTSGGPYLNTAIAYTADSGQDSNSEDGTFRDISIQYVKTGYAFGTLNGEDHVIEGGSVQFCSVAAIDTTPISPCTNGGSFVAFGTRFAGNALTLNISQGGGSSDGIALYGIQAGTTANPETQLLNTPVQLSDKNVIFIGGYAILAPPGAGNSIFFNGDASAYLEFHGFRMTTTDGNGVVMNFSSGSPIVNFYGGKITTKSCSYNGQLHFHGTVENGTSPVFTPTANSVPAQLVTLGYKNHISGSNGYLLFNWNVLLGGAPGAGASVTMTGGSLGGVISLTTGASPSPGTYLQVGLPAGFPVSPLILFSAGNSNAVALMNSVYSIPNGGGGFFFNIGSAVGLVANTSYVFNYMLVG